MFANLLSYQTDNAANFYQDILFVYNSVYFSKNCDLFLFIISCKEILTRS